MALLNTDMKIFTTILSTRLQRIITQYIAPDQMGFIPGHSMTDNVRKTLNIIRHCKQLHLRSLLVALVFEKVFDSIEFSYLQHLLHHMNFEDPFKNAITALYLTPVATLRINNRKSNKFLIRRGTRKGCPLSPLLFTLCIEPLVNLIRTHASIQGIRINNAEYRVSLLFPLRRSHLPTWNYFYVTSPQCRA